MQLKYLASPRGRLKVNAGGRLKGECWGRLEVNAGGAVGALWGEGGKGARELLDFGILCKGRVNRANRMNRSGPSEPERTERTE